MNGNINIIYISKIPNTCLWITGKKAYKYLIDFKNDIQSRCICNKCKNTFCKCNERVKFWLQEYKIICKNSVGYKLFRSIDLEDQENINAKTDKEKLLFLESIVNINTIDDIIEITDIKE